MSILNYFKKKTGLLDPKGSLSSSISPTTIATANKKLRYCWRIVAAANVENVVRTTGKRFIVSTWVDLLLHWIIIYRYSPKERAKIGKYAMIHSISAAMKLFTRKLSVKLSETTVRSICDGYLEELKQRRWAGDNELLTSFPEKQHGRSLLLGNNLDENCSCMSERSEKDVGLCHPK